MDLARVLADNGPDYIEQVIAEQAHTIDLLRTTLADTADWLERTDRGGTAHHRHILDVLARTEETN